MRKLTKVVAVVGAALLVGLLTIGTVTVAGPPPGPPGPPELPPKPEPPPPITVDQIIQGVNQLIPSVKFIPPPPELQIVKLPPEMLDKTPTNRIPMKSAFPKEGVRLYGSRSLDDGTFLDRQAGVTGLGAIELEREYKLGSALLTKGLYGIAAIYDPENKLDRAIDPENKIDFYLALYHDMDGDGKMNHAGLIGLPRRELERVMLSQPGQNMVKYGQLVLLNLVAALLQ